MDERQYEERAGQALERVLDLFDEIDPDVADVERAGDVVTIDLGAPGGKVILNTQRPARQLWLAGGRQAWHFDYDAASESWRSDRDAELELFAVLGRLCGAAGVQL